MQNSPTKYNFRRRDYLRIRNWYDFAKQNYIPEQPNLTQLPKQDKKKIQMHYKFSLKTIQLSQFYVNQSVKQLLNIKQLIFLSSLYNKNTQRIISHGKQIRVECEFDVSHLNLNLKEDIDWFFYLQQKNADGYQLFLEVQIVDGDGELSRLGAVRHGLEEMKDIKKNHFFVLMNHLFRNGKQDEQINDLVPNSNKSKLKPKDKNLQQPLQHFIGKIQFQLDIEPIKDIKRFLPPYRIIDKTNKISPTSFNLKNKKQPLTVDSNYQLTLQQLMLKVQHVDIFKKQILNNNPFTLSHKEMVEFQIKEYRVIVDNHNGWKFFRQGRNQIVMDVVVQKGEQIYLSSKKIYNIGITYYQSQLLVLLVVLMCKVEFKLKGVAGDKQSCDFLVGWLPLPLDLSQKYNTIELAMVNDLQLPTSAYSVLGVHSTLIASVSHPLSQKYKSKHDQKRIFAQQLLTDHFNVTQSAKYVKLKSKRIFTDSLSSEVQQQSLQQVDVQIQNIKNAVKENEKQRMSQRVVIVKGIGQLGQERIQNTSMLPLQSTVGKTVKVKLQIDTLIPETNFASEYYLPRRMKATIHFLRQTHNFSINISQQQARFHIPLRLNQNKLTFYCQLPISTVDQYNSMLSSRLIVTLYEEQEQRLYAKGVTSAHNILGAPEGSHCAFVKLLKWQDSSYKIFGTLLVNVQLEVEKARDGHTTVQPVDINKVLHKMPAHERMKMRIGLFKGDQELKTQAVSKLKKIQHNSYISSVVSSQLKCDGQIDYEIGMDSYYLLHYINQDKSQVNTFTFHLNCPYAQLVTDQQQYLSVIEQMNIQRHNFHKFKYILKDPQYHSYYQTQLRFNQEIGLLVKLNVSQYSSKGIPLVKLEVIVKRNTLESKRFHLRCKFKESFVYDVVYDYGVLEGEGKEEVRMPICHEITVNYRDILVLNKHVGFSNKTKEIIIQKPEKNKTILMLARPVNQTQRKIIAYQLLMLKGQKLSLFAGQPTSFSIQLQNTLPAQVLRSASPQIQVINTIKFYNQNYNESKDLLILPQKPYSMRSFVINILDLTGQFLSQYILKIQSTIQFISAQIEIVPEQNGSHSVHMQNPYACGCNFRVRGSSRAMVFEDDEIKIEGYGSRVVLFKLSGWQKDQLRMYIYMLDINDNLCQIVQVDCRMPKIQLQQFLLQ